MGVGGSQVSKRQLFVHCLLLVAVSAGLYVGIVKLVWSPLWVEWTRNAYPMAAAGVWTGVDAFIAIASNYFIEFYGRTIVTVVSVCCCLLWVIFVFYKIYEDFFKE